MKLSIAKLFGTKKKIKGFRANVFNRNNSKNALVSITNVSLRRDIVKHSSATESLCFCEALDELGYNVDVAEAFSDCYDKLDYNKYDVIAGLGKPYEASFNAQRHDIKRVFYCPGASPIFQSMQSIKRLLDFREKHGKLVVDSARIPSEHYLKSCFLSDVVLALSNDFVADTFEVCGIKPKTENVRLFYFDCVKPDLEARNWSEAKKNFVWFGSSGMLHKGLDLVLEYFKKHPELTLHVCGIFNNEVNFINYYETELGNELPNIINHGFVDIRGDEFKNMIMSCGAVIFPSASEGGSPSLLNVIANGGVIPITSRYTGIEFENEPFYIETLDDKGIEKAVASYLETPETVLKNISEKLCYEIRGGYTVDNFKSTLRKIFNSL